MLNLGSKLVKFEFGIVKQKCKFETGRCYAVQAAHNPPASGAWVLGFTN